MNWQHFQAFLWLHWRLASNRRKRAGTGSAIIEAIVAFISLVAAGVTFLLGLSIGLFALPKASPSTIMLVWDGFIVAFLFIWQAELVTELQRSEVLSFDKFLHLPVSLSGILFINYFASFFSMSVNLFLPAMIGLSIGLVYTKGIGMIVLFPMVAALFFMVTALTYQFRGWLASLMTNKRRRRNIATMVTVVFVLIFQVPNLVSWMRIPNRSATKAVQDETAKLDRSLAIRQIDLAQYQQQTNAIYKKYGMSRPVPGVTGRPGLERVATIANEYVPPGWVAYGAMTSLQGNRLPSLLATLGLTLIGVASLGRSYRTTIRLYTGQFVGVEARRSEPKNPKSRPSSVALVERVLPWISEHASAVATSSFRSLTRAPEAKMMLLTPVIFTLVFGSMFLRNHSNPSEYVRPLMAAGLNALILFGLSRLAGNQFGMDRSGFRVFVLAPVSRKDVLLGKNLALLPFALGLEITGASLVQIAYPMRIDHFVALLLQTIPMYLLFCILSNFLSIFAPMPIPSGSLRPAKPTGMAILLNLAFLALFPALTAAMLIPLAIEFLLKVPVYVFLTLAELAVVVLIYPRILSLQGNLLQEREQQILEVVTAKVD